MVAATLEWLAAFRERCVYADDVISTGNEDEGFHTSHLITSVAYNLGYTMYGPVLPTFTIHLLLSAYSLRAESTFRTRGNQLF